LPSDLAIDAVCHQNKRIKEYFFHILRNLSFYINYNYIWLGCLNMWTYPA